MNSVVAERDARNFDTARDFRQFNRVGLIVDGFGQVKHGENSVDSRHCLLQTTVDSRQPLDGVGEVDGVCQKCDECARRHYAVDDFIAAEPDNQRDCDCRQKFDRRREQTRQLNVFHRRIEVELVFHAETVDLVIFAHERLDDAD